MFGWTSSAQPPAGLKGEKAKVFSWHTMAPSGLYRKAIDIYVDTSIAFENDTLTFYLLPFLVYCQ